MAKLISQWDCNHVLDAAFKMTGNEEFIKIKERLLAMQNICDLATKVVYPYPTRDGYRDGVEKLIKERAGNTAEFLAKVLEFNKNG